MRTTIVKPVTAAIGIALLGSAAMVSADSLFALKDLGTGYQVADNHGEEGSCGEGSCGMAMMDDNKDGMISLAEATAHGKTAEQFAAMDGNADGNVDQAEWDAAHADKAEEGKCGEGKCGEGKCGGAA
jgi:uncharacterized low-complexity protein